MWWKYAKVGQKVTMVADMPWGLVGGDPETAPKTLPRFGVVYEIVIIHSTPLMTCGVELQLKEMAGWFDAADFRPVIDNRRIAERVAEIIRTANSTAPKQVERERA